MNTSDLALATGMTRDRIDALESGCLDPTYELMLAIAEGLGTQPSAVVTLAEQLKETGET